MSGWSDITVSHLWLERTIWQPHLASRSAPGPRSVCTARGWNQLARCRNAAHDLGMAHRVPLSRGSAGFRFYVFAITVLGREPERTGLCHSNGRGAVTGTLAKSGALKSRSRWLRAPATKIPEYSQSFMGAIGPVFYCWRALGPKYPLSRNHRSAASIPS